MSRYRVTLEFETGLTIDGVRKMFREMKYVYENVEVEEIEDE